MATNITKSADIDSVILNALSSYIKGRADAIVEKHVKSATDEITDAVRNEVSKTVLSLGKMLSIEHLGSEIIIKIYDERKQNEN